MSCAKRARRLKIVLRSGNICTNVIAGSKCSVAKRHWQCTTIKLCQSALPGASPARREESLREGTSQGLLLCNTPKNRVAALLPRTVSRTTRVEAGPPPPPPAWPARNLLLETQRRRREKDTSLGRLVKRVSRSKLLRWRCWPSKSVVSRRIVRSDIIPFDSRPRIARANREN